MLHTTVIAEAGVNHNGSLDIAIALVDAAVQAGADVIKFQTFKASSLVTSDARQADYQIVNTARAEPQIDMLRRLELDHNSHRVLIKYCESKGISFLSTPFDSESLDFLVNDLNLSLLKVPSGEVTNGPLLLDFARTKRKMIVSTGMSSLADIENCLSVLAFGLVNQKGVEPGVNQFREAYFSAEGQRMLQEYVSLLHCTTEYPAPFEDINLAAMDSMRSAFGLPVGYSDHSTGIEVSVAAVARGARIIEKHFTLDRTMEGPDHKASLEPQELSLLVSSVRNIERAIGDGLKGPRPSEVKNIVIARKSLVARNAIKKGEVITADMLTIKRPGSGQSPMNYWNFVGSVALRDYRPDEVIV